MTSLLPSRMLPLCLALSAALGALPAGAQSLIELYEAAKGHDAAFQSARAQAESARFRAEQGQAGLLPTAGLAASASRSEVDTSTSNPRDFQTRSATIQASQPLYRPANLATWRQGQRQAEAAKAQLAAASQDLIVRVSQAYFDVLGAQDTLNFVRAQKAAVSEQLASARRNFEVGTATITDTREAQARFDLVQAQEIQAENDLQVRKLALDTVTGRRDARPLPLATPLAVPAPQPADVDAWVKQAEDASPSIAQARLALDVARLEVEKARAGHKPTVDLTASRNFGRNVNGNATQSFSGQVVKSLTNQYGVTVNIPLFAGFATENRVRETLSLEDKARADLDNALRTVSQATRTAYFGVVSGAGQVKALEAAEASSQSALEANRLGYQVGVRINIDVLNAQSQLFQTKRDLSVARYNVLLGHLKLRQAAGTLQAEDLAPINGLLVKP